MTDSDFDNLIKAIDWVAARSEMDAADRAVVEGVLTVVDPTFSGPNASVRDAPRDNSGLETW